MFHFCDGNLHNEFYHDNGSNNIPRAHLINYIIINTYVRFAIFTMNGFDKNAI